MSSYKELEKICRIIDTFSVSEHIHILKIINDNNSIENISENNNGIFINMDDLSDSTVDKIRQYVDYVLLKEGDIQKTEDTKDKLKNYINTINILNHVET